MLPRRSPLVRWGAVGATIFFTTWLYLVMPPPLEPRDIIPYNDVVLQLTPSSSSRVHTPNVTNSTEPKHTHHHSNDTLQKLARNMTLLKVNQTALEQIIQSVNQSIVPDDEFGLNSSAIVNPHPFDYLINQKGICKNKDIFLIVYVHTAPKHYKRRMVIRQTWGDHRNYDVNVRVIFVMGKTSDEKSQSSLYFESEQYGDIVQEDFLDSYKNLTYKAVAALKWITLNCKHAKFVLKSDDDMFVNMFTLIRHLKSRLNTHTDRGLLMCLVWNRMKVMRAGKWKVSEKDYKDTFYPTYCSGSAFTMSTDVAIKLHKTSYYVPFFWVDDLYITGFLPMKNGVKHTQLMSTYVLDGRKLDTKFTGPQWYSYIFSHVHSLDSIQTVWHKLKELDSGAVIPRFNFAIPQAPTPPAKDKKPIPQGKKPPIQKPGDKQKEAAPIDKSSKKEASPVQKPGDKQKEAAPIDKSSKKEASPIQKPGDKQKEAAPIDKSSKKEASSVQKPGDKQKEAAAIDKSSKKKASKDIKKS